jgi:hypothetical protein
MARIASRRNRALSLDPNLPGQLSERDSLEVNVLEGLNRSEKGQGDKKQ